MRSGWMKEWLLLGLGACAGAAPGDAGEPTVAASPSAIAPAIAPTEQSEPTTTEQGAILMAVRGVAMDAQRSERRPLQIDDRLQSGDFFAYYVRVDRDAYLYVLQFYPDGSAAVLFPSAGAVKVSAGAEQRLPADERGWFRLDEATGTEHLYVIAAEAPLEQSDPELAKLIGQVRTSPKAAGPAAAAPQAAEQVAAAEPAHDLPVPAAPPASMAVARLSDPLLRHARERAAVVVRVDEGGLIEYQGRAHEGVGVVHFPFRHE